MTNGAAKRVVYITGSTGFLGGYLVQRLEAEPSVSKVYCPIRTKKGMSGTERLKKLLGDYSKAEYVPIDGPVPTDTTHIMLNAYSTRFNEELRSKLDENVEPILRILDECKQRRSSIKGIVLVSTAYVHPPLPFPAVESGRLPFLLKGDVKISATEVYDKVMDGIPIQDIVPDIHPYYKENSYVFSKHMLEHMIAEKYSELPVCVVRPSMIAPPLSFDYGLDTKSAVPLMMQLSPHYVVMAPCAGGKVNIVLIEHVSEDVMNGAFRLARPAAPDAQGTMWNPIIHSTGSSHCAALKLMKVAAPHIPRMEFTTPWLRGFVRSLEYFAAWMILGSKASKLLHIVYDTYDFFMENTWAFEERYKDDVVQIIIDRKDAYFRIIEERSKKNENTMVHDAKARLSWLVGFIVVFLGTALSMFPLHL